MNNHELKNVVEAALLAAGRPVGREELRDLFEEFERPNLEDINVALEGLKSDYGKRGIELKEVASGWRIQIRESAARHVSKLWQERPAKYSRALLETLALVAYRQPVTRGEIEAVRGITVNPNIIRTLSERGWVRVVGHREAPGRPELLGTTHEFLDYFGLKSLDELPSLAELNDLDNLGVQLELPDSEVGPGAAPSVPPPEDSEDARDGAQRQHGLVAGSEPGAAIGEPGSD
jgi:segregation and condensation protein B